MGSVRDTYTMVTTQVIEKLDEGVVPWRKSWSAGLPSNLATGKHYRGVNVFLLATTPYESRYWVTYRQAQLLGGHVRKGQRGTSIIFWKWMKDEEGEPEALEYPLLRRYTVFNTEQCNGLETPTPLPDFEPVEAAERIVQGMPDPPRIEHRRPVPSYRRDKDRVNMPRKEAFSPGEEYYATLFHELVHSTGHEKRLNRFGTHPASRSMVGYSLEELAAEMGAAFLCAHARIEQRTLDNQAAYIAGWLSKLKDDRRFIITASAEGQRAADYILDHRRIVRPGGVS